MPSAVVVGAGVFGASLAYRLRLDGWEVTLADCSPPGHVRAASGGESRLIRYAHGDDEWYTRSAWRARDLWRELEAETGTELLVRAGVLWLAHDEGGWEGDSERVLRAHGIPVERLALDEAARLFPGFDPRGLAFALFEPEAGVLRARDAVRTTVRETLRRGVRFVGGAARPVGEGVEIAGERLHADRVIWACGAWLAGLFPEHVQLRVTRQEVFFFGGGIEWETPPVPAWVDYERAVYGLGDLDGRGVKVAPDAEGPEIDPEVEPRSASAEGEAAARTYLAERFPTLAAAPLVGARVCQYALTADTNFVIAPHPEHERVWLVGGGSGHGFKHGPALAEYVAGLLADGEADARFALGPRDPGRSLRTAGTASA